MGGNNVSQKPRKVTSINSSWTLGSSQHAASEDSHFLDGNTKVQETTVESASPLTVKAQNWPSVMSVIFHWLKQLPANSDGRGRERDPIS